MHSYQAEPLTQKSAAAIARTWIDDRMEKPTKAHARSQMRWLLGQLAGRCIAESVRCGEDEDGLYQRLDDAHDVIYTAWCSAAPNYATQQEGPAAEEKEKTEKARHTLWVRHDPKRAFAEGTRSEHYAAIDKDSLQSAIADYLDRPYLRHPVLDWIFLDMSISREISAFGEALKERWLPGKRDALLGIHSRYIKAQGNLAEMSKIDWNELFERWNVWFWWTLAFPIGAIWAAFHWGFETTGWWLVGIYTPLIVGFIVFKLLFFVVRWIGRLAGIDTRTKVFQLWDRMYEVWTRLEGPVVNPTRVREAMVKSTDGGAVWDTVSWSLIDRVIACDPAVWVVQPGRD